MTGRQLAAMETKKKLLAAAKRLIGERGLADVAVEEITGACGVAKGTFYTYFKKKEDIVFELSEEMFGEILENAKNAAGGAAEKLKNYMSHFSECIEKSGVKLAQEWVRGVVEPPKDGSEKRNLRVTLRICGRFCCFWKRRKNCAKAPRRRLRARLWTWHTGRCCAGA